MFEMLRFLAKAVRLKLDARRGPEHLQALQQRRLRRLVRHARQHSPFHAERLRDIDPERFELRQLPVMTKTEMMADFDRVLTDRRLRRGELEEFLSDPGRLGQWYRGCYAVCRTSGTQGVPALIVQDRRMMELLFALQIARGSVFAGGIGVAKAVRAAAARLLRPARLAAVTIGKGFFPSAVGLAYAPPAARRFMDQLWLTHIEPLAEVVEQLNRYQPDVLLAYANVLEILAREALAGRLRLDQAPLRQLINMSEPLSPGAKRLLEQAFALPVTNNYASGECMHLSLGCPQGYGMHLQTDWAILEVVDREYRPVPPDQPGDRVLITNLANTLQPFIRYELADAVMLSPTPCPCGSPFPLIREVAGRSDEVVWVRENGRYRQVHPYVFIDVLDEYPPLGWYQIVQRERNRFLLRAVPAPGRRLGREELHAVLQRGLRRFGLADLVQFEVEITTELTPDPNSGKLKRITSCVGPPDSLRRGAARGRRRALAG